MAYLLAISFLLHFVALFAIIVLIQKINANTPTTNENEKLKREIEDLLIAYTTEMKAENETLVNKIIEKRQTPNPAPEKAINFNRKVYNKQDENTYNSPQVHKDDQENTFVPLPIETTEDIVEKSSTAQILSLAKQGYSTKAIAKQLNIGDGEVELLLKFHK